MFWSKNKKKIVYPCKPQFYYIKVGCKGVFVTRTCFRDDFVCLKLHFLAFVVDMRALVHDVEAVHGLCILQTTSGYLV